MALRFHPERAGGKQALADGMDVDLGTVYRWLAGENVPRGETLVKLIARGWATIEEGSATDEKGAA